MLFSGARKAAAVAFASASYLLTPSLASIEQGQSTFISPQNDLAFGFTIPNDTSTKNSDIYFSIAATASVEWAAVGLGSHDMDNALVFMIYASADGKKVTLSPRVSTGTYEPKYEDEFDVEELNSEIVNGTMLYSGKCENCRNWNGGYLDVTSQTVPGIYATGPNGGLKSDKLDESVRYHWSYGAFNIDMRHATGPAGAPDLDADTSMFGAELDGDEAEAGKKDWKSVIHAVVMILVFVGLMPFGVVILRVANSVRWHWVNQTVAAVGVVIGVGLGIYDSFYYQRSRGFNTAHQVIGIIVFVFVFGQWTLGFLHHRAYKRTQQTTKMAPIHVWLGRLILILAVVNAFLGFPLAKTPKRNYILAGLVVAVTLGVTFLLFTKGILSRFFGKKSGGGHHDDGAPRGYDPEPWRHVPIHGGNASQPYDDGNMEYRGGQSVGLSDMSGNESSDGYRKERGLGSEQTPREYV